MASTLTPNTTTTTTAAQPPASAASSASPLKSAIVRSVLSGDTVVIRPKGVNTPGKEETVRIAGIAAPRLGSRDREDDPQAFPSREYLRLLLVGREIRYRIEHTVPAAALVPGSTLAQPRQFAHVFLPPKAAGLSDTNVAHEVLSVGWAKVHDSAATPRKDESDDGWKAQLRAIQLHAQTAAIGLWGPDDLLKIDHSMPQDTNAFLAEWKGKPIEAIVEQVRDGSMLRVRLLLSPKHHQLVNLNLAGIKAPRVVGSSSATSFGTSNNGHPNDNAGEPFAEESKFFVESRLLQRNIKVTLLSVPQPVPVVTSLAQLAVTANAAPTPIPPASMLIGTATHPVGDIAQFLLAAGLARCVDWHAGMLYNYGGMEKYRQAEKTAKEKRLNVWKSYQPAATASASLGSQPVAQRTFNAVVSRIISGDTVQVRKIESEPANLGPERRIQLSSIRQPQVKDAKLAGYAVEAKQVLRKKLIGKTVSVQMDYVKPQDGDFDEREYATVRLKNDSDVGLMLVSRGLATVQRHRRDDEDRSPDFDKLMEAEAKAMTEAKGLHSGKELSAPRISDASETVSKANSFLPGLKRAGRIPAVVDFVASASRFKLIVPRENIRMTFVLAGIRAPKTARNPSEKDEPFGRQGLEFTTLRALQRDVEIQVYSIDKAGGFIGALYLSKTENLGVSLVENGLANVHGYSAESTTFTKALLDAQDQAKASRKGVWTDYNGEDQDESHDPRGVDPSSLSTTNSSSINGNTIRAWGGGVPGKSVSSSSAAAVEAVVPARTEYVDCIVSDVRGDNSTPFSFSIQILNEENDQLEQMMSEFSIYHKTNTFSSKITPKVGDFVSAQYSIDQQWYRAQVKRIFFNLHQVEVVFIDYGNQETISIAKLRNLDSTRFGVKKLAGQSKQARLSFIKLFEGKPLEYKEEAIERFRSLTDAIKLIANIDFIQPQQGGGGKVYHITLYDPTSPNVGKVDQGSLNYDLVKEGWAVLDYKIGYSNSSITNVLKLAHQDAKKTHKGCFEYGDPTQDDE